MSLKLDEGVDVIGVDLADGYHLKILDEILQLHPKYPTSLREGLTHLLHNVGRHIRVDVIIIPIGVTEFHHPEHLWMSARLCDGSNAEDPIAVP